MFKKFPAAGMNNRENPPTERLIDGACDLHSQHTPDDSSQHFPSYLRLFGTFFGLLISESFWRAARLLASCWRQFRTAPANVAFL